MSIKLENKFVSKFLSQLYLNSHTADVHFKFAIDDEIVKVPAHRNILATSSPVFDKMFFGSMKEGEVVNIVDSSASAFEEFLQFFYLPDVTLTMENIETVARLTDKYDVLDHVNMCAEFLMNQLTEDNMIWGYQLAISLNNQKLEKFCECQIKLLTSDAFKSDIFLHCDKVVVENILQLDQLSIGEADLFIACVKWATAWCQATGLDESKPENLRNLLGDCFYLIRYGAMTNEEIGTIMSNKQYESLFSRDELRDLLCLTTVKNFQSNIFKHKQRTFKWNIAKVVACALKFEETTAFVQNRESTWFSTNVPVLLGYIKCISVMHCRSYFNLSCSITLFEYNDLLFSMNRSSKVLYNYTVAVNLKKDVFSPSISLAQPIVIQPYKMYEIRLDGLDILGRLRHCTALKDEINLDEEAKITIHRGPLESNYERCGAIEVLHFNRI